MMKKVVGTFERVSDAVNAVREVRAAGLLASDVDLVVRSAKRGVTAASGTSGAVKSAVAGGLAGGVLGALAWLATAHLGVAMPGVGPILSAGLITAALAGTGVGAITASLMGGLPDLRAFDGHTQCQAELLRSGGALVAVYADESRVGELQRILHRGGAYIIESRVVHWRDHVWPGDAPPAEPHFSGAIDRSGVRNPAAPARKAAGLLRWR